MRKEYLEFLQYGRQLSQNTIKAIESDFEVYGDGLEDATRQEVEKFVMDQNKQKLSTATVARRVASLKGFFDWQIMNGYRTGINPAAGKIAPKIKNKAHEAISYDELVYLYDNAPNTSIKVAIALMGFAGMRIGEVVGLGNRNVVYRDTTGTLAIHLTETKGDKERKVTLGLVPDSRLVERAAQQGGLLGKRGILSENGLWRQMSTYFKEMGHDDMSPHALRATFATISVERGINVAIVRDMLGHSTLDGNAITSRYVSVASVEQQRKELLSKW